MSCLKCSASRARSLTVCVQGMLDSMCSPALINWPIKCVRLLYGISEMATIHDIVEDVLFGRQTGANVARLPTRVRYPGCIS